MILLSNILIGLGTVLDMLLGIFVLLIIGRAIISWVNPDPMNPIVRFLLASTDPLLRPIQKILPPFGGTIDLSPLVLLALLYFLKIAVAQSLIEYAQQLKRAAFLIVQLFV